MGCAMIVLGLGVNLGDRLTLLRRAVEMMTQAPDGFITAPRVSHVYESSALLPPGAPAAWDMPFYNMALAGETALTPEALLEAVKELECKLGRQPRGYWGPREMDIDILAYGDRVMQSRTLTLPQRELLRRDFALVPMEEVAPDWAYPAEGPMQGKTVRELVKLLGMAEHYGLKRTPHKVKLAA
jgi:2-amino-4-hydroxy-6-hydroxymethyldihydropteridine diphosphokinase